MEITEWEGIKGRECIVCLEWKPLDDFIIIDEGKDLFTAECKDCSSKLVLKHEDNTIVSSSKKTNNKKKISKSKDDSFKKITYLVNNEVVDIVSDLAHLTGLDKGDILGELVKKGLNILTL